MLKNIIILLLFPVLLMADNFFFLHKNWKQMESEHFILTYPAKYEQYSKMIVITAEEVHSALYKLFPLISKKKTQILLTDNSDLPNGSAQVASFKKIILYFQPPDSLNSLSDYKNWFRLLLFHEYTHILQLDQATLLYRFFLFSPNNLLPIWMIEGIAVYDESKYTGYGRGHSSYIDMILRSDFLKKSYPNFSQLTTFPTRWSMGTIPYIYGYKFYEYLSSIYGEPKIKDLGRINNLYTIPYFWGMLSKKAFGISFPNLYKNFLTHLAHHYKTQIQKIKKENISVSIPLIRHSYLKKFLIKKDNYLYFYSHTADDTGKIIQYSLSTRRTKVLIKNLISSGLTVLSNTLYYTKLETYNFGNHFYDLYSYNLINGKKKKLTKEKRVFAPFSDNHIVYYISRETGTTTRIYSITNEKHTLIFDSPPSYKILEAQKVGNNFYCIIKKENGYQDIYKLTQNFVLSNLTQNSAIETTLSLSKDNTKLLFSADYNNIYNLYEMDVTTRKIKKLTHFLTSGFFPILATNQLFFIHYNNKGFGVSKTIYSWKPFPNIYKNKKIPLAHKFDANQKLKTKNYSFFPPFLNSAMLLPYAEFDPLFDMSFLYGLTLFNEDLFNTFDLFLTYFNKDTQFSPGAKITAHYKGLRSDFTIKSYIYFPISFFITSHYYFYFFKNDFGLYSHYNFQYYSNNNTISPVIVPTRHDFSLIYYFLLHSYKAIQYEKGFLFQVSNDLESIKNKMYPVFFADFYYPLINHIIIENHNLFAYSYSYFSTSLNVNIPLFYVDSGYNQWPLYVHYLSVNLFYRPTWKFYKLLRQYYGGTISLNLTAGYRVRFAINFTISTEIGTKKYHIYFGFSQKFSFHNQAYKTMYGNNDIPNNVIGNNEQWFNFSF